MFWLTAVAVLHSFGGKKYNCSSEVRGLGDIKIHAYKATHCHYTAKPAELPPLWSSSGNVAGKAISPYSQVHSTQVQNQLVVGFNGQAQSTMPEGSKTSTETDAAAALHSVKTTVDFHLQIQICVAHRNTSRLVPFKRDVDQYSIISNKSGFI